MPALNRKFSSHWTNSGCWTGILGEFCSSSKSHVGQIAGSSQPRCGQRVVRKESCSPCWMASLFTLPQQLHSAGSADTTVAVWEQNGNEMLAPPKKFCFFPLELQRNSGSRKIIHPIKQYFPASKSQRRQKHKVKLKYSLDEHTWTFYRLVTLQLTNQGLAKICKEPKPAGKLKTKNMQWLQTTHKSVNSLSS